MLGDNMGDFIGEVSGESLAAKALLFASLFAVIGVGGTAPLHAARVGRGVAGTGSEVAGFGLELRATVAGAGAGNSIGGAEDS